MAYKSLPFLTRAELQNIWDLCVSVDGCRIFQGPRAGQPSQNLFRVHGGTYCVARLVWSETHCHTVDLVNELATHEVIHIAECPNTGDHRGGHLHPLCIEPSHLMLADRSQRIQHSHERMTAYQGGR